jgi:hypothetical protein
MPRMTAEASGSPRTRQPALPNPVRSRFHRGALVHEGAARALEERAEAAAQWDGVRLRARAAQHRRLAARIFEHLRSTRR